MSGAWKRHSIEPKYFSVELNWYYYLVCGIGPQKIDTEGIACLKVFSYTS